METRPSSIYDDQPKHAKQNPLGVQNNSDAKLVIIGDPGSGKTSTVEMFCKEKFKQEYIKTLGANLYIAHVKVDEQDIDLIAWDLSGQAHFIPIRKQFYKGAKVCLIEFDLTREETFEHIPGWVQELASTARESIPLILVGNKVDLVYKNPLNRQVPKDRIRQYTLDFVKNNPGYDKRGLVEIDPETNSPCIPYIETSAKDNINVKPLFEAAARFYLKTVKYAAVWK